MDNPCSRQEPEPTSRATPEALYSETALGCTFSPRIRTGIAGRSNLQLTGLAFTQNSLFQRSAQNRRTSRVIRCVQLAVYREWCVLHRCAAHIAPAAQLYMCSDAGCTAVRADPSGVYTCMEGVISPVQLYGLYGTVCTRVHVVYSER